MLAAPAIGTIGRIVPAVSARRRLVAFRIAHEPSAGHAVCACDRVRRKANTRCAKKTDRLLRKKHPRPKNDI
eukprot:6633933-Prymnesium_polylepis.1